MNLHKGYEMYGNRVKAPDKRESQSKVPPSLWRQQHKSTQKCQQTWADIRHSQHSWKYSVSSWREKYAVEKQQYKHVRVIWKRSNHNMTNDLWTLDNHQFQCDKGSRIVSLTAFSQPTSNTRRKYINEKAIGSTGIVVQGHSIHECDSAARLNNTARRKILFLLGAVVQCYLFHDKQTHCIWYCCYY